MSAAEQDVVELDAIRLGDPDFWIRPDRLDALAQLRRHRPISWQEEPAADVRPAGPGFWALTRYEDVRAASRIPSVLVNGFGFDTWDEPMASARLMGLATMDDPEHKRMRALSNVAFMPPAIEKLQGIIAEEARSVVDALLHHCEAEVVTTASQVFPGRVICRMMGISDSERLELLDLAHLIIGPDTPEKLAAHRAMVDYCAKIAVRKREHPGDDVTSRLATAELDGAGLSEEELGIYVSLLTLAGLENTGAMMAQGLIVLSQWPDQLDAWRRDVCGLTASAVEELLRFVSPALRLRRTATVDVEIGGQWITAGEKVALYYVAANRDEEIFEEPDRLDLGRDPNRHLAFGGGGPHFCLGAHLARSELRAFFAELLSRVTSIDLVGEPIYARNETINEVESATVRFGMQRG